AEEPTAPVNRLYDALLAAMKEGPQLGFDGRERKLAPVISDVFDMPGMTRTAMGSQASKATPEQIEKVVQGFTHYTVATYARQFDSWDGERFEVGTPNPAHGGGMLVPSHIIPSSGEKVLLTYLVREQPGGWRVEDILLEGSISQLAVRRAEFQAVLKSKGADALAETLERRATDQAKP
ncbi:MAG TPA: ABC transporter substrate-binding protein, partial [Magnetospirillum sp.]|nr:ABC transporter substrate-binding protein [Magnetospirillum sp.]